MRFRQLYLNVLSISSTYAERIIGDLSSPSYLSSLFTAGGAEWEEVQTRLEGLHSLPDRLRSAQRTEMEHLFVQVTRPRLRALLQDSYRDVHYSLTEEAFHDAEYHDLFFRRFTKGFDHIVCAPFRHVFSDANFDAYFALCVENVVRPWERLLLTGSTTSSVHNAYPHANSHAHAPTQGMRFTEWGAMRFDKDWRSVSSFLSAQTSSGEVRDKFARLQQSECPASRHGVDYSADLQTYVRTY